MKRFIDPLHELIGRGISRLPDLRVEHLTQVERCSDPSIKHFPLIFVVFIESVQTDAVLKGCT